MAVLKREEIIAKISASYGDDNSDDAIALIEDITDTFDALETKANGDGKDWKAEAQRIDKEWREKYVSRFSKGSSNEDDNIDTNVDDKPDYSFEKLFRHKILRDVFRQGEK